MERERIEIEDLGRQIKIDKLQYAEEKAKLREEKREQENHVNNYIAKLEQEIYAKADQHIAAAADEV